MISGVGLVGLFPHAPVESLVGMQKGFHWVNGGQGHWPDIVSRMAEVSGMTMTGERRQFMGTELTYEVPLYEGSARFPRPGLDLEFAPGVSMVTLPSPYMFLRMMESVEGEKETLWAITDEVLAPAVADAREKQAKMVVLYDTMLWDWPHLQTMDDEMKACLDMLTVVAGPVPIMMHLCFGNVAESLASLRNWCPLSSVGLDLHTTPYEAIPEGLFRGIDLYCGCYDGSKEQLETEEGLHHFMEDVPQKWKPERIFVTNGISLEHLKKEAALAKLGAMARWLEPGD